MTRLCLFHFVAVSATLVLVSGCGTADPPAPVAQPAATQPAYQESTALRAPQRSSQTARGDEAAESVAAPTVQLQLVGTDGLQKLLERHRGKVVFIDYWATWCVPCIKEFPRTVQLHESLADRGLAVASVSVDDPEKREQALRFLEQQRATFDNLICEAGASDATFRAFGIPGPIPFYQLYDRQGELRFRFSPVPEDVENTEAMEQIELRIQELLAELPP